MTAHVIQHFSSIKGVMAVVVSPWLPGYSQIVHFCDDDAFGRLGDENWREQFYSVLTEAGIKSIRGSQLFLIELGVPMSGILELQKRLREARFEMCLIRMVLANSQIPFNKQEKVRERLAEILNGPQSF